MTLNRKAIADRFWSKALGVPGQEAPKGFGNTAKSLILYNQSKVLAMRVSRSVIGGGRVVQRSNTTTRICVLQWCEISVNVRAYVCETVCVCECICAGVCHGWFSGTVVWTH